MRNHLTKSVKMLKFYLKKAPPERNLDEYLNLIQRHRTPDEDVIFKMKQSEFHSSINIKEFVDEAKSRGIKPHVTYDLKEKKEQAYKTCKEKFIQELETTTEFEELLQTAIDLATYAFILQKKIVHVRGEFNLKKSQRLDLERIFEIRRTKLELIPTQLEGVLEKISKKNGWKVATR